MITKMAPGSCALTGHSLLSLRSIKPSDEQAIQSINFNNDINKHNYDKKEHSVERDKLCGYS